MPNAPDPKQTTPHTPVNSDIVYRHRGKRASAAEWHQRLGHMHAEGIRRVVPEHLLLDKIPAKLDCRVCIQTKHQVTYSRIPALRSKIPFERIHSDLCGSFRVTSTGNSHYYIVYIDDCTRYQVVYFLTSKASAEIIVKWRHFNAWVKAQGYTVRHFHCDNSSGEYANEDFQAEISSEGIT